MKGKTMVFDGGAFGIDFEKGTVAYNSECRKFLNGVKRALDGGKKEVILPVSERKDVFEDFIRDRIGLIYNGTAMGTQSYIVPDELTENEFEKAISFEGVKGYVDSVDVDSIGKVWYSSDCPLCGDIESSEVEVGENLYLRKDGDGLIFIIDRGMGTGDMYRFGAKYCPMCGKEL